MCKDTLTLHATDFTLDDIAPAAENGGVNGITSGPPATFDCQGMCR